MEGAPRILVWRKLRACDAPAEGHLAEREERGWAEQVAEELIEVLIVQGEGPVGDDFILGGPGSHGGLLTREGSDMNEFKLGEIALAT